MAAKEYTPFPIDNDVATQLNRWQTLKNILNQNAPLVAEEMSLRKILAERISVVIEGTKHYTFDKGWTGWTASVIKKQTYKLTNKAGETETALYRLCHPVTEHHSHGAARWMRTEENSNRYWRCIDCNAEPAASSVAHIADIGTMEALVKWEPVLSEGTYKKLSPEQQALLSEALTISPGAPTLELTPPKDSLVPLPVTGFVKP